MERSSSLQTPEIVFSAIDVDMNTNTSVGTNNNPTLMGDSISPCEVSFGAIGLMSAEPAATAAESSHEPTQGLLLRDLDTAVVTIEPSPDSEMNGLPESSPAPTPLHGSQHCDQQPPAGPARSLLLQPLTAAAVAETFLSSAATAAARSIKTASNQSSVGVANNTSANTSQLPAPRPAGDMSASRAADTTAMSSISDSQWPQFAYVHHGNLVNVYSCDDMLNLLASLPKIPRTRMASGHLRPFTVQIEGNIGAGKSRLFYFLEKGTLRDKIDFIPEPLQQWIDYHGTNMVEKLYSDPKQYATTFQHCAYVSLLRNHLTPSERCLKIMERSIHSSIKFMTLQHRLGNIDKTNYHILMDHLDLATEMMDVRPDLIIFMEASKQQCKHNINIRNRAGETVDETFLAHLDSMHRDWINESIANGQRMLIVYQHFDLNFVEKFLEKIVYLLEPEMGGGAAASN